MGRHGKNFDGESFAGRIPELLEEKACSRYPNYSSIDTRREKLEPDLIPIDSDERLKQSDDANDTAFRADMFGALMRWVPTHEPVFGRV